MERGRGEGSTDSRLRADIVGDKEESCKKEYLNGQLILRPTKIVLNLESRAWLSGRT